MHCETEVSTLESREIYTAVSIKSSPNIIDSFVSIAKTCEILGISSPTYYRMINITTPYYNPECPVPVYVSCRRKMVRLSELKAFMANRTSIRK